MQAYGHDKISILDGGLPMWMAKGYPTVSGAAQPQPPCTYTAKYQPQIYRTLQQMIDNISSKKEQVSHRF